MYSRIRRWQHANEKREASPSRQRSIIASQRFPRGMSAHASLGRQTDERDQDTNRRERRTNRIDHGQNSVAIGHNHKRDGTNGVKDEQELPRGWAPVRVVQRNRGGNQRRKAKVDRQGDGPVADEPGPARDEGQDGAVARVGELERPVVGSRGGGIPRGEFAQGERDALVYDKDDDPT